MCELCEHKGYTKVRFWPGAGRARGLIINRIRLIGSEGIAPERSAGLLLWAKMKAGHEDADDWLKRDINKYC